MTANEAKALTIQHKENYTLAELITEMNAKIRVNAMLNMTTARKIIGINHTFLEDVKKHYESNGFTVTLTTHQVLVTLVITWEAGQATEISKADRARNMAGMAKQKGTGWEGRISQLIWDAALNGLYQAQLEISASEEESKRITEFWEKHGFVTRWKRDENLFTISWEKSS